MLSSSLVVLALLSTRAYASVLRFPAPGPMVLGGSDSASASASASVCATVTATVTVYTNLPSASSSGTLQSVPVGSPLPLAFAPPSFPSASSASSVVSTALSVATGGAAVAHVALDRVANGQHGNANSISLSASVPASSAASAASSIASSASSAVNRVAHQVVHTRPVPNVFAPTLSVPSASASASISASGSVGASASVSASVALPSASAVSNALAAITPIANQANNVTDSLNQLYAIVNRAGSSLSSSAANLRRFANALNTLNGNINTLSSSLASAGGASGAVGGLPNNVTSSQPASAATSLANQLNLFATGLSALVTSPNFPNINPTALVSSVSALQNNAAVFFNALIPHTGTGAGQNAAAGTAWDAANKALSMCIVNLKTMKVAGQ